MAEDRPLNDPWLVAVWPGMGSVAMLAGSYLLQRLGNVQRVWEIEPERYFEVQTVDVAEGLATGGRLPRGVMFQWDDPMQRRDLLLFLGEAQPAMRGYEMCREIVEYAKRRGIKRIITVAAMATQLHPSDRPRVFAVATDIDTLNEVRKLDVEVLDTGQITGLNGVLLSAGAERGINGVGLLGELPFYAVGVPNPRAAQVALERFSEMSGIEVDLTELAQQAETVERQLLRMLQQLERAAQDAGEAEVEDGLFAEESAQEPQPQTPEEKLDVRLRRRIESLFDQARRDRSKAFELKQELDRLGVFKQYEDRFLDLFRHAE